MNTFWRDFFYSDQGLVLSVLFLVTLIIATDLIGRWLQRRKLRRAANEPHPSAPEPEITEEQKDAVAALLALRWVEYGTERFSLAHMLRYFEWSENIYSSDQNRWIPFARLLLQPYIDRSNCWLGMPGAPDLPPHHPQGPGHYEWEKPGFNVQLAIYHELRALKSQLGDKS